MYPALTVHTFYVKYLLPIYFDVHCFERADRLTPRRRGIADGGQTEIGSLV